MSTATRRALFAALPAVAAAPMAMAAEDFPDAELIALGAKWTAYKAEYRRLDGVVDACWARFNAECGERPEALRVRQQDRLYAVKLMPGDYFDAGDVDRLERAIPKRAQLQRNLGTNDYVFSRGQEVVDAYHAYRDRRDALLEATGFNAASEEREAVDDEVVAIERQIEALPAQGSEGLRVKAMVAAPYIDECYCPVVRSLVADLLR